MVKRRVRNRELNKSRPLLFRRMELIDRWPAMVVAKSMSFSPQTKKRAALHKKQAADDNGNTSGINVLECTDVFVLCLSFTKPSVSETRHQNQNAVHGHFKAQRLSWR